MSTEFFGIHIRFRHPVYCARLNNVDKNIAATLLTGNKLRTLTRVMIRSCFLPTDTSSKAAESVTPESLPETPAAASSTGTGRPTASDDSEAKKSPECSAESGVVDVKVKGQSDPSDIWKPIEVSCEASTMTFVSRPLRKVLETSFARSLPSL